MIKRATGNISKSFSKYLSKRTGKHAIMELQKMLYYAMRASSGKY